MARTHVSSSDHPQKAPSDYRDLPAKVVTHQGDGLFETWHGSGVSSEMACAACGNTDGNLAIFKNWGTSYPNGNSWDDTEIVCGQCGKYTYVCEFWEG